MTSVFRRDFVLLALAGLLLPAAGCQAGEVSEPEPDWDGADLLAWLKARGPDDWHRCACTWNWDQPYDVIRWIIRQPDCDAGTAVTLFARGQPGSWSQYKSVAEIEAKEGWAMENVRFLIEICERWEKGQYKAWRFRPDELPGVDPKDVPWPVPASLAGAKAQGMALDFEEWNEGFPPVRLRGSSPR